VSFQVAHHHYYVFNDPDLIRDVLITQADNFRKGPALRHAKVTLGEGLLTSEADFHRRQRRLSQPAFHAQRVNAYASDMTRFALRMGAQWQDDQTFDAHEAMMELTLAIVAKTLFDADVETEVKQIGDAMNISVGMFTRAMLPFGPLLNYLPLPGNFRFQKARRLLWDTLARFVEQRRASGVDRGDLLSMLLRARDTEGDNSAMTDTQLRDEAMTLFTAGHETSANALTYTWYLLAQNPAAESALHAELDTVLAGRAPTHEDLPKLDTLRRIVAESMRLYPPAWALGRQALHDCTIGPWHVPAQTVILMSQWVTHRDERFWPDAQKFDPDRWLPEQKNDRPRWAYYPFGGGTRQCIGESFAWMEATLALATIAQCWRLQLVPHQTIELQPKITLRPRAGIKAVAIPRP
jgi:cytochrome P450